MPLVLFFDDVEQHHRVSSLEQALPHGLVAQEPRDPRERLEVIAPRVARREQRDEDPRRQAVDGVEADALRREREHRLHLAEAGEPAVRDRDAAPDARRRERLARLEHAQDLVLREPRVALREHLRQRAQRGRLVLRAQAMDDPLDGEDLGETHALPSRRYFTRLAAGTRLRAVFADLSRLSWRSSLSITRS